MVYFDILGDHPIYDLWLGKNVFAQLAQNELKRHRSLDEGLLSHWRSSFDSTFGSGSKEVLFQKIGGKVMF